MGVNWLKRLVESEEEKAEREHQEREEQMEQLKDSPEFKAAMKSSLREAFSEFEEEKRQAEEKKKQEHQEKVDKAKVDITLVGESMQDSPEPFANVLAMGFSKEHGIEVKLDFNPAFIRYLNAAGIQASNDEETIRIWLAHMADDILREEIVQDYIHNGVSEDEKPELSYDEMFGTDDDDDDELGNRWEQSPS